MQCFNVLTIDNYGKQDFQAHSSTKNVSLESPQLLPYFNFSGGSIMNQLQREEVKFCIECEQYKPLSEFKNSKITQNGVEGKRGKLCLNDKRKLQRKNDPNYKIKCQEYRENNREKLRFRSKEWKQVHYNAEKENEKVRLWRLNNPEKVKAMNEKRANNPERQQYVREYGLTHKKERNIRKKLRRTMDYRVSLNERMSAAIQRVLKNKGGVKWENLVGYNTDQLKNHLEKKFKDGMSWDKQVKNWLKQTLLAETHPVPIEAIRQWAKDAGLVDESEEKWNAFYQIAKRMNVNNKPSRGYFFLGTVDGAFSDIALNDDSLDGSDNNGVGF